MALSATLSSTGSASAIDPVQSTSGMQVEQDPASTSSGSGGKMSTRTGSYGVQSPPGGSGLRSPSGRSKPMKRVLSHGSSGSATSAALRTPKTSSMVLTPDVPAAPSPAVVPDAGAGQDVEMAGAGPGHGQEREDNVKRAEQPIAARMEDLKMRSPDQPVLGQGMGSVGARGAYQSSYEEQDDRRGESSSRRLPHRSYTSSSDSEASFHPYIPSQSGSIYNADGFAKPVGTYGPYGPRTESPEMGMMPAAHAAVSAADEAIKQLNGTAATVYGGTTYAGFPPPPDNPYQLPRGFAGFVRPQHRSMGQDAGVTRQSSMSSSTTEASTSSEEEDLTLPSVMWLPSNRDREQEGSPNPTAASWLYGRPQRQSQGQGPGRGGRGASPFGGRTSPQKMPPPPIHRVASPHFRPSSSGAHFQNFQALPTSTGISGSALPTGLNPSAPDVDDDHTTLGAEQHEQPSSASSISASSGLDLLWRAVNHDNTSQSPHGEQQPNDIRSPRQEGSSGLADPNRVVDSKGKRKAGAEAVAQWRQSGIPLGIGIDPDRRRRESTNSTDAAVDVGGDAIMSPPPPKKRRKSSAQTDLAQAQIKKEGRAASFTSQGRSGGVYVPPPTSSSTGQGRARSASTDANGDAEWESEPDDEEVSTSDSGSGGAGSEYGVSHNAGGASARQSSSGRIRKPSAKMQLAAAYAQASASGSAPRRSSASKGGKGSSKVPAAGRKGSTTSTAAAGSAGKKSAGGTGTASPAPAPQAAKGKLAHIPAGGVQCEYVNPLPPYNRCQDVFTRKYDLPRHMARHARREGELVLEGVLAADKAALWNSIKDKPKVQCTSCGESFTRMDALKRHQAKQHH